MLPSLEMQTFVRVAPEPKVSNVSQELDAFAAKAQPIKITRQTHLTILIIDAPFSVSISS
jgi:hypothetical protein